MTQIAILRAAKLPGFVTWDIPNFEELFEDDDLLVEGFKKRGCHAEHMAWNAPDIDWDRFDAVLVRSTYDYLDASDQFLNVLGRIEQSRARLFNSLETIRWNIDKNYLLALQADGVPTIPTFPASGFAAGQFPDSWRTANWHTAILKPTLGLGGSMVTQVPAAHIHEHITELAASSPHQTYLVQPFIDSIVSEGEWSFVYFNGHFSHAMLKTPASGDFRVQGIYGGSTRPASPSPEDVKAADTVMRSLARFAPLCVRLDMVRLEGRLHIMEVELIEPVLNFNLVPAAVDRLVSAALERLSKAD